MRILGIGCKLETWDSLLFLFSMTSLSVNRGCDKSVALRHFVPDYTGRTNPSLKSAKIGESVEINIK